MSSHPMSDPRRSRSSRRGSDTQRIVDRSCSFRVDATLRAASNLDDLARPSFADGERSLQVLRSAATVRQAHYFFEFSSFSILIVQQNIRHHLLQLRVLSFEFPKLLRFRDLHAAILAPPSVERLLREFALATNLTNVPSRFCRLKNSDDLLV